jgi:EF hand
MTHTLAKISLATALILGTSFGLASAQQTGSQPNVQIADNSDGQDDGFGDHGGRHGGHRGGHHMQRMIDTNNDGVIGEDEAASLADGAFNHMDQDQSGTLSEAEYSAGPRGHRGWFSWNSAETAAVLKVRKDKFVSLDTDKNATLSKAEFFAGAKSQLAAADTNKDGKVSPWEFRASR